MPMAKVSHCWKALGRCLSSWVSQPCGNVFFQEMYFPECFVNFPITSKIQMQRLTKGGVTNWQVFAKCLNSTKPVVQRQIIWRKKQ